MKERLLGAAVLIAAAVLIIPAFLDGPRSPSTVSQQLELPVPGEQTAAATGSNRTHTVQIGSPDRTAANDQPVIPEAVPPITTQSVQSVIENPPVETVAAAKTTREAVAEVEPVVSPEKPISAATGWAVQVGSFTNESNARRLMEYLKGNGYPAFVVRNVVNGRVMFRVRVGPESDRLRADALLERLKSDRQQTQLVRHP